MLLVGLVFGRWWKVTIPVGTAGWVFLLVATGTEFSGLNFVLGAAAMGAINVVVGVLVYQACRWVVRGLVHALQG
jgi:hypothetical protein